MGTNVRKAGLFWMVCSLAALPVAPALADYLQRAELRDFIDRMVQEHDFDADQLQRWFGRVERRDDILESIANPAEGLPWHKYQRIFLTDDRVRGGVEFWADHESVLQRAEQAYGVPAEIIVAILGVETRYGTYRGKYPVLESLTTLAFDYPKRAKFFKRELEQFLLLAREENVDPLSIKGSYAGAMGGPQFISSSYRRYAIDFDDDGRRDLWNNYQDIVGSVANYFHVHGWQPGQPVGSQAQVKGRLPKAVAKLDLKPKLTVAEIRRHGVIPRQSLPTDALATVISLEQKQGYEHWVALQNFYVITRYNHSPLYAMAVYQLSRSIKQARAQAAGQSDATPPQPSAS